MARPFGIVDDKLAEAEFFLSRFKECGWKLNEARYYFNAFVSSTRSVTFAMQASLKGTDDFESWYECWQGRLRKSKLARFFHECRTDIQHVGRNFVNGGVSGPDGPTLLLSKGSFENSEDVPEPNAFLASDHYFGIVCSIVRDAYDRFGHAIDPDVFYTINGMRRNGMTFEDVEEELGLPRGWTSLNGEYIFTEEDRMSLLRRNAAISNCRDILNRISEPPVSVWS